MTPALPDGNAAPVTSPAAPPMDLPLAPSMAPSMDPLADLRGYHLPDPVSWWPPAPGWWLLAILGLVLITVTVFWLVRRYRRGAAARAARAELGALCDEFASRGDPTAFARGLSRLLRRFALVSFPLGRVAGLIGDDWLAFLDTHGGDGRFRDGPGRLLIEAPYRPAADLPVDALADLARDWIARNGGTSG